MATFVNNLSYHLGNGLLGSKPIQPAQNPITYPVAIFSGTTRIIQPKQNVVKTKIVSARIAPISSADNYHNVSATAVTGNGYGTLGY